jgi:outer membrane protein TolC
MRIRTVLVGALFLILSVGFTSAETRTLTLDQAIELGLENSLTVKSKKNALESAQASLAGTKASIYPNLSANAGWMHLFEQPESPDIPVFDIGTGLPNGTDYLPGGYAAPQDPISVSIDVGQTIYTFGKVSNGLKLSEEAVSGAALDLEEERRTTVVQIKNAFYGYLLAREVQRINQETLESKREAFEVARERYDAGLISDFEVLNAESDLESFRSTVISADNGVLIALLGVKNVLGVEDEVDLQLVGELEPIEVQIDREVLMARALSEKYDLRSLQKGIEIMEIQKQLDQSLRKPTVSGWFNYTLSSGMDADGKNDYFTWESWNHDWTAGIRIDIPISGYFPWSKETADLKRAQIDIEGMRVGLKTASNGIRLAVESAILKIAEEQAKIDSGKKSVALAERLYESALDQYRGGYISSMDLKDSQLALNGARLAYTQAVYSYNLNVLELMNAVGVSDL